MALNDAKALLAKIASDPETAKIFAAVTSAKDFDEAARKFGYACTLDEFVAAKNEGLPEGAGNELSDEELAQTSGGLSLVGLDYAFTMAETAAEGFDF